MGLRGRQEIQRPGTDDARDERAFGCQVARICDRGSELSHAVFGAFSLHAQTACAPTPAYSSCEIVFELSPADLASYANPYKTVELSAEFRSPRHRTFLLPAYWDGGQRMVIRFTPVEAGSWDFRVSSNIAAFEGKTGQFTATESESPGFVRVANMHHFATTAGLGNTPHLWMGDTLMRLAAVDDAAFRKFIDARAAQKFTHIRGNALGTPEDTAKAFPTPNEPDPGYFRQLDERIRYANQKSMTVDPAGRRRQPVAEAVSRLGAARALRSLPDCALRGYEHHLGRRGEF
jgi:hypothetical protein